MCDHEYYRKKAFETAKFVEEDTRNKVVWFQHLLLGCSTVLGLIAALQTTSECTLSVRVVFALTIFLLATGTVGAGVALYGYQVYLSEHRRLGYIDEVRAAVRERRAVDFVAGKLPKRYVIFGKICYGALLLAVLFLVVYSALVALT